MQWAPRITRAPSMRLVHIMEPPHADAIALESAAAQAQRSVFLPQSV